MKQLTLSEASTPTRLPEGATYPPKDSLDAAVLNEFLENEGEMILRVKLEEKFKGHSIRASVGRLRNDYNIPIEWNRQRHPKKSCFGFNVPREVRIE